MKKLQEENCLNKKKICGTLKKNFFYCISYILFKCILIIFTIFTELEEALINQENFDSENTSSHIVSLILLKMFKNYLKNKYLNFNTIGQTFLLCRNFESNIM